MKPKSIFGEKIKYVVKDLEETENDGEYCPKTKTIFLDKRLKGRALVMTKFHEELHALWDRILGSTEIDANTEEIIVRSIEAFVNEHYDIKEKKG